MPNTMKIEFTGEFKADIEKRGQATAVHLVGEAFDALKAKMVELGLLNVSGDIRTVPERAPSVRKSAGTFAADLQFLLAAQNQLSAAMNPDIDPATGDPSPHAGHLVSDPGTILPDETPATTKRHLAT